MPETTEKAPEISVYPWSEGGFTVNVEGAAVGEAFDTEAEADKVAEWLKSSLPEILAALKEEVS